MDNDNKARRVQLLLERRRVPNGSFVNVSRDERINGDERGVRRNKEDCEEQDFTYVDRTLQDRRHASGLDVD